MKPADCLREVAEGQARIGAEMYARHGADLLDECERVLRPFADIGVGTNPDYAPTIRLDREAVLKARATLAKLRGEA